VDSGSRHPPSKLLRGRAAVVNVKAAKLLGIDIPTSVLLRADQLIE